MHWLTFCKKKIKCRFDPSEETFLNYIQQNKEDLIKRVVNSFKEKKSCFS